MWDEENLLRVLGHVKRILPSQFDHENIALDILFHSWKNDIAHPPYTFIRQKCIDHARKRKRESMANEEYLRARDQDYNEEDQALAESVISNLVRVLSVQEKQVIFYMFYMDLKTSETAKRLSLSPEKVREIHTTAVFKMRQEIQ